jgi:adhesin/invasin
MMRIRDGVRLGLAALVLVAACGKSKEPVGTTTDDLVNVFAVKAGNAQSATVGHAVAIAPSVSVTSSSGQPRTGVGVTFSVASGGGSITGATVFTDASGTAQVGSWTLGSVAGANALSASSLGTASLTFTATGSADVASLMSKTAGDAQTAAAGLALTTKPAVSVVDHFGNAVAGVNVTFAVASGGGSVSGATTTTGVDGIATLGGWTLGSAGGSNTVTATVIGATVTGNPLTFTATGTVAVTLPSLAGSWHGTWVDTRYGVTGTITNIVLTQTASTFGGTGTIDLSSVGMGVANGTATGTISGNVVTFTFTAAGIGSGTGTLNGTAGSGTGGVTALNFGNFTFTGTVTATQITGTFQFTSPTGGNGTITVTKP